MKSKLSKLGKFWLKVDLRGAIPKHVPELGRCWQWLGSKDKKGYGNFYRDKAHRFSHKQFNGALTVLKPCVLHRCDNPSCVNPKHLWAGTNAENMTDRNSKGRQAKGASHGWNTHPESRPAGEKNGRAILSLADVLEIRKNCTVLGVSQKEMVLKYGLNKSSISKIVRGISWIPAMGETKTPPE